MKHYNYRMRTNIEVREEMIKNEIHLWEVADLMGVSESTLVKRFRHELPQEEQKAIIDLIRNRKV